MILTLLSMPAIITANYTILPTDRVIRYDSSGGVINFQLPDPTIGRREIEFINVLADGAGDGFNLVRFGSEKIQNVSATKYISKDLNITRVISDLTNYYVGAFLDLAYLPPNILGSLGTPQAYDGTVSIPFSGTNPKNIIYLESTVGAILMSASPQIQAGNFVGQELELIFTSDTKTLEFSPGTGLEMLAVFVSSNKRKLNFGWDGSNWSERFRR